MVKQIRNLFFILALWSCSGVQSGTGNIITVSISPFKFFVEAIGGSDFKVNVMVPSGADPHIYEPAPGQVAALSRSVAYISNGHLGFEITWLDRFYEANKKMKKLSLGKSIDLIESTEHDDDGHSEGADPHFWIAPRSAKIVAASVKELLCELKPERKSFYEQNFSSLSDTIDYYDKLATTLFSDCRGKSFMIYHPALGYLARDYNLNQISVETEGKEPNPSSMRDFIDKAGDENIRLIFIQKGFDTKNAGAIASEIGAELREIDPLDENWPQSVEEIITAMHESIEISSGKK
jgi:zinc transport system substrate-binding protein